MASERNCPSKKGDVSGADKSFRKAAELDKIEPTNYYAIGMLFYNSKKFEEAVLLFRISNLLEPKAEHLFMASMCSLMLKKPEEAELGLNAALSIDKKKTARLARQFFDRFYKNNESIPPSGKIKMKAVIKKLIKASGKR